MESVEFTKRHMVDLGWHCKILVTTWVPPWLDVSISPRLTRYKVKSWINHKYLYVGNLMPGYLLLNTK